MVEGWESNLLQAVLFEPAPVAAPDAAAVWHSLFGTQPTSINRPAPGGLPIHTANGFVDGFQAAVQHQPGRLDLVLMPAPDEAAEQPLIADVNAALTKLSQHVEQLLSQRRVVRLAIVANLVKSAQSEDEARALTRASMPTISLPPNAVEIQISFNAPRAIRTAPAVQMNRLCKWGSIREQRMQMLMHPTGGATSFPVHVKDFAVWNIDVNTVAQPEPFAPEYAVQIFDALYHEMLAIMKEGHQRLYAND